METGRRPRRTVVPGYVKVRKLGDGSQAQVFEMVRRNDGDNDGIGAERFAVKVYRGEHAQRSLQTELRLLLGLQGHGSIVRLVEYFDANPNLSALVLELCETDLYELHSQGNLSQSEVIQITRGALSGLKHVHNLEIVHRDVKPENIGVAADGTARLIDFGVAASLDDAEEMNRRCGSLEYLAPEMFNKKHYGLPVDMFAFGATLYYVLGKQHPLATPGMPYEAAAALSRRYTISYGRSFDHVDKDSIDLISWLLHPCDTWRPEASFAFTCPPYAPSSPDDINPGVPSFESQLQFGVNAEMCPPSPPQQAHELDAFFPYRKLVPAGTRLGTFDSNISTADALPLVKKGEGDGSAERRLSKLERTIYSAQVADEIHGTSFNDRVRRKLLDEVRKSRPLEGTSRASPESIMH
eukprot:TRINITY_DN7464_c1_g1_i2.p1 TRINITY_DN7464_c1_g1~~TRINITY_DN7464_c1_g1_i2.p1  ORF type:complete len:410 (+),score=51.12 TRINITY_DN7464_c1_g1_i2:60-1289(+)